MAPPSAKPLDPRGGLRAFLVLDMLIRSWIWSLAAGATVLMLYQFKSLPLHTDFSARPLRSVIGFANVCVFSIFNFNMSYVLILFLLRLLIPTPREGRYTFEAPIKLDRSIVAACFIAILTRARYEAPFPGFIVFNLANMPPFVWLLGPVFGPKSRSCWVVDPKMLDPYLTEIGRNVVIGYGTIIAAHSQERHAIVVKKTVIEDDVLIGGNVIIFGGCRIKRGAVVLSGAVIDSNSVVGENELWGGLPAKKIKDLPPYDARASQGSANPELAACSNS